MQLARTHQGGQCQRCEPPSVRLHIAAIGPLPFLDSCIAKLVGLGQQGRVDLSALGIPATGFVAVRK